MRYTVRWVIQHSYTQDNMRYFCKWIHMESFWNINRRPWPWTSEEGAAARGAHRDGHRLLRWGRKRLRIKRGGLGQLWRYHHISPYNTNLSIENTMKKYHESTLVPFVSLTFEKNRVIKDGDIRWGYRRGSNMEMVINHGINGDIWGYLMGPTRIYTLPT